MRDAYGKLIYLLQDSVIPEIQELLQFTLVRPIHTVHSLLTERNALNILDDEVTISYLYLRLMMIAKWNERLTQYNRIWL